MNNTIFFQVHENPKSSLENFITFCKNKLTAFGSDCWDNNQWRDTFNIHNIQVRFPQIGLNLHPTNMSRYLNHLLILLKHTFVMFILSSQFVNYHDIWNHYVWLKWLYTM